MPDVDVEVYDLDTINDISHSASPQWVITGEMGWTPQFLTPL
jgi:hypothetical protein